jgi:poly-gamma-glutamate biosynthesis protein PgsC/CapC
MVVPGYVALYLGRPVDVILTLAAAIVTYLIVHTLSTFIIVYGRRRTVLMILVGYLVRMFMDTLPVGSLGTIEFLAAGEAQFAVIGYIIPGLIAIWMDRQGIVETICALIAASVMIRMILILIFGTELLV